MRRRRLKRKKKEASDFLAPPPASLLEARPFSSVKKPLGDCQSNSEIASVSIGKAYNNLQNGVIDVDVDEGKENICPSSTKKHRTTVAGTDLFSMFTSAMSKVDPTMNSIATLMQQRNPFLELAEQRCHEAEECARRAEERSQHLQLLQMLHW